MACSSLSGGHWAGTYGKTTWCYFSESLDATLKLCIQRLFLLKQLRDQGMARGHLHTLFQAIVFNRIAHAFPAWGPFLNIALSQRINGFFKRSYRYGFTNHVFKVQELLDSTMRDLFTNIQSPEHCLHPLLPPKRGRSNRHRPKGHDYELPDYTYNFHKQSYVINCLFKFL